MATPQHSGDEHDGSASPAPPPPPPPPPPQDVNEVNDKPPSAPVGSAPPSEQPNKRVEYRDLFALFHADVTDPAESKAAWDGMYQLALVEAREELRVQLLEAKKPSTSKKRGSDSESISAGTPSRAALAARLNAGSTGGNSSASGISSSAASSQNNAAGGADKRPRPPLPSDSDPNKAMRLNRAPPNRPKPASKLMQKLGTRGS